MIIAHIQQTNERLLLNSIMDIRFERYPFSFDDFYGKSREDFKDLIQVTEIHDNDNGRLVYREDDKYWFWEVFDQPRKVIGLSEYDSYIYQEVKVVDALPLIYACR